MTDRATWVGIPVPVIIEKELFDKVQARLAFNKTCFRNAVGTQLFSNMVFCDGCGDRCFVYRRSYVVERKDGPHAYQRISYHCRNTRPCHNVEIDTRLLESCVTTMVEQVLFKGSALRNCMEVFNKSQEANQEDIRNEINDIDEKIKKLNVRKRRIVDLYAGGDLDRESYVQRIYKDDSEINILKVQRTELMKRTPSLYQKESIEESIMRFAKEAKAQYRNVTDFTSRRRLFLDHLTRISYLRKDNDTDVVTIHGVVPIYPKDDADPIGTLAFSHQSTINRAELSKKLNEVDERDQTVGGTRIESMQYGELVTTQTV